MFSILLYTQTSYKQAAAAIMNGAPSQNILPSLCGRLLQCSSCEANLKDLLPPAAFGASVLTLKKMVVQFNRQRKSTGIKYDLQPPRKLHSVFVD